MAARAKPASHPVGMDTLAARAGSVGELRRYRGPQRLIDMATQMARVAIEAKRADEALRQSEDRLRLVIDTIPTMAWSLLPDGTVDFVNQRWLEYTGLSLEEALANSTRTVHPEDLPRVMEKWRTDMAVGKPCEDEMRLRGAGGEYRWFLVRTVPLRNEQGNIVKWYGTSIDIEDRKRAEEKLRSSEERWRAVFESSGIGIAIMDLEGHFVATNRAFQEIVGYTDE